MFKATGKFEDMLTLFKMSLFGAAHGWGEAKRPPLYLKYIAHILQRSKLAQLYLI